MVFSQDDQQMQEDRPNAQKPLLAVKFALLPGLIWGWLLIVMSQPATASGVIEAPSLFLSATWQTPLILLVAISLLFAKSDRGRTAPSLTLSLIFGTLTILLMAAQPFVPVGELLQYLALRQVLAGSTCAALLCLWSRCAQPATARQGSLQMLLASALAVIVLGLYSFSNALKPLILLFILGGIALSSHFAPPPASFLLASERNDQPQIRALIPSAICAYSLLSFAFRTTFALSEGTSFMLIALAGVCITGVFALYFQRNTFTLRAGMYLASCLPLLICLSALLVLLFPQNGLTFVAFLLNTAAFLLGGLMFFLPSPLALVAGKSATFGLRLAALLFFSARLAGEAAVVALRLDPTSSLVLALVSLAASLLLLLLGFWSMGFPRAEFAIQSESSSLESKCAELAREHNLTEREAAVLLPLAKGHTVKSISEQFTVSFHTVRSQVRSIYLKLGIHSREELLKMLESQQES